jgi:hypothetical protein
MIARRRERPAPLSFHWTKFQVFHSVLGNIFWKLGLKTLIVRTLISQRYYHLEYNELKTDFYHYIKGRQSSRGNCGACVKD